MKLNKKAIAGAGLGALALVGGSFAYYNQTLSLENPLQTPNYGGAEVEEFIPPTNNLQPGQIWNKDVWATNTGDAPLVVRIRMKEEWTEKDKTDAYKTLSSVKLDDNGNVVYNNKESEKVDAFMNSISTDLTQTTYNANQEFTDADKTVHDGLAAATDDSVVLKKLKNVGKDANQWVDGGDGYWYWNGVLEEGAQTEQLLDELILANNMDIGLYDATEYYYVGTAQPDMDSEDWKVAGSLEELKNIAKDVKEPDKMFRKDESKVRTSGEGETMVIYSGYSNSEYKLTVYSEFVQATDAAVIEAWGENGFKNLSNVTKAEDGSLSSTTKLAVEDEVTE